MAIARASCREGQPMTLNGACATTVADLCEEIAEGHEKNRLWRQCATAYRMANYYYRKSRQ